MTRAELLAEVRVIIGDTVAPYLWADARLIRMLSSGQDKFCEDTGYFIDFSTYEITLVADTYAYDVPARVIQILDVYDGTRKLEPVDEAYAMEALAQTASDPYTWFTGGETAKLWLLPKPSDDYEDDVFTLRAWRYAINELSVDIDGSAPALEIPPRFHMAPAHYAASLAFADPDADTYDVSAAQRQRAEYHRVKVEGKLAADRMHSQELGVRLRAEYTW